MTWTVLRG
jgi:hypothetical protein